MAYRLLLGERPRRAEVKHTFMVFKVPFVSSAAGQEGGGTFHHNHKEYNNTNIGDFDTRTSGRWGGG